MTRSTLLPLVGLVLLVTQGCAGSGVRVMAKSGDHGQIALSGSAEHVREAADEFLRRECKGAYTVLDESPNEQGEWKIAYRCETGGPEHQASLRVREAL